MDSKDFQTVCVNLKTKYENNELTDADVDTFADLVSNILGRDDLKSVDSEYDALSSMISEQYENDINMNPLLARMYEICRMWNNFRPRPLTDMERKAIAIETKNKATKRSTLIEFLNNKKSIASIWFEDLHDVDGIMRKVAVIADELRGISSLDDDNDAEALLIKSFAIANGEIDQFDEESKAASNKAVGTNVLSDLLDEKPNDTKKPSDIGIVALGTIPVERNRGRGGVKVMLDLDNEEVRMDAYTVYDKDFYQVITGNKVNTEELVILPNELIEFKFAEALEAQQRWEKEIDQVFAFQGSPNLVGTKKPLPVK